MTKMITVCDRCRKEIPYRRTFINLKPVKYDFSIDVYIAEPLAIKRTASHSFELCDECANELAKFLEYSGSVEEKKGD